MRLLVIVNVFEPDLGGGVLFSDLCYGLAERGFDVTVRCAYPYYPEWRDKTGRNGLRIRRYRERGVKVERFGIYIPSKPNELPQRLAHEASFFASLIRRLPMQSEFDGMMVFCPLIGAVAYAAVCRRLTGLPLWLNVQDLPAEAAASGGISGQGRALARLQDYLFNEADTWSTISPAMVELLGTKRQRRQPLLYVPNWLHSSLARKIAQQPEKSHPEKPVKLLYSGSVGTKQNLLEFCRTLGRSASSFRLRIHAEGSSAEELREWIAGAGDERFAMSGLTDEAGLAMRLREADFALITERADAGRAFIPSKLIPALASGTPILAVCAADSPLGQEMEEHRAGVRFGWDEAGAVGGFLASVDVSEHAEWRRRALERSRFYDRDRILDVYARELRRFCSSSLEHTPL